jgi:hypothetical protein
MEMLKVFLILGVVFAYLLVARLLRGVPSKRKRK